MIKISDPYIWKEEIDAARKVLERGVLARGNEIRGFEEEFARFIGSEHAIATSNGTTALHVAMLANGITSGEVITSAFSFIASANSILHTGAKPVLADVDPVTFNISADSVESKINKNTKAVMPVHLYGQSCEIKKIRKICDEHGLILIEDACQAHGAEYGGRKVGSFGTGCFSFYATKNMTTGEGGMITTNDDKIAEKARMAVSHGSSKNYDNKILGYNFRMTEIQAAIGRVQLSRLDAMNEKRIENAKILTKELSRIDGVQTPVVMAGCKHVFHQYTIKTKNREALVKRLNEKQIGYGIYYPKPIHKQDFYVSMGYNDNLPESEKLSEEVISLPVHPKLNDEQLEEISVCVAGRD